MSPGLVVVMLMMLEFSVQVKGISISSVYHQYISSISSVYHQYIISISTVVHHHLTRTYGSLYQPQPASLCVVMMVMFVLWVDQKQVREG